MDKRDALKMDAIVKAIMKSKKSYEEILRFITGKGVGFDFGLKKFLVSSDGSVIEAPMLLKLQIAGFPERRKAQITGNVQNWNWRDCIKGC
jgi:hypothetical protein